MNQEQRAAHHRMLAQLPSRIVTKEEVSLNQGVRRKGTEFEKFKQQVKDMAEAGMSSEDIAIVLDVARSTVWRYMNDERYEKVKEKARNKRAKAKGLESRQSVR